ncbi:MAG TPA: hypothetical protein VFY13_07970 [Luteolibacter sp.]|nr:hypothetical protein [Luteolibacter sp.]
MFRNIEIMLILLLAGGVFAASPQPVGGLTIVNATGRGTGALTTVIDGKALQGCAESPGQVGPNLMLPVGTRRIQFSRDGLAPLSIKLRMERAITQQVVVYAEWREASHSWCLAAHVLEKFGEDGGPRLQLLSCMSRGRVDLALGDASGVWRAVSLERLAPLRLPLELERGYLPLRTATRELPAMPVIPGAYHHLVFYDDVRGMIHCVSLRQRPWLTGS